MLQHSKVFSNKWWFQKFNHSCETYNNLILQSHFVDHTWIGVVVLGLFRNLCSDSECTVWSGILNKIVLNSIVIFKLIYLSWKFDAMILCYVSRCMDSAGMPRNVWIIQEPRKWQYWFPWNIFCLSCISLLHIDS